MAIVYNSQALKLYKSFRNSPGLNISVTMRKSLAHSAVESECVFFSSLDSKLNKKSPDAVQKMISTRILYSIHCCTVLRITSFSSSGFTPVDTVNRLGRNLKVC